MADHTDAVLELLRAHPYLTVEDGHAATSAVPPYVAVYVTTASERRTKLDGGSDEAHVIVTTHSIATTAEGARIVRRNVRQALLDQRPQLDGWAADPITHERGLAVDTTTVAGVEYQDAVDEWDFRSQPA